MTDEQPREPDSDDEERLSPGQRLLLTLGVLIILGLGVVLFDWILAWLLDR